MTLSRLLVELLRQKQKDGISGNLRTKTRLHIADSLGIAVAAQRRMQLSDQILAAAGAGHSRGACSVFGSAERLPPTMAAFANAALIHALDFDDIHDIGRLHPTTVTLPAALAAAEVGNGLASKLVDAVALGNELMCRLGVVYAPSGSGPGADWFLTQLFGYFGAAAAACIILDCSDEVIQSAFGLAYMQAAGGKEAAFGVGGTARSIYPAFAAMGGVHAALLARAGIIGPASAFDGSAGLFPLYLGGAPSRLQIEMLLAPEPWTWSDTDTKPWPTCRLSHPYVAAALAIKDQVQNRPIERIVIAVNASAGKLCKPIEQRRRPRTLQDAKYSIPFITAFALAHGRLDLNTIGPRALEDTAALNLAARVDIAETLPDNPGHPPAEITVEFAGGSITSAKGIDIRMNAASIKNKFVACLDYAGLAGEAEGLWDDLMNVETRGLNATMTSQASMTIARSESETVPAYEQDAR